MGQEQFNTIMPGISAELIEMISEKQNISEGEAIKVLYDSKIYAALEQEDTKVWQSRLCCIRCLRENKITARYNSPMCKEVVL